jgi:hypothetical protein
MAISLQQAHEEARNRFLADPSKCYQRHIREVWAEIEQCPQLPSLSNARVERISREQAASIILKYEWLAGDPRNKQPLGKGSQAFYGLILNEELLGATCIGRVGAGIGNICGKYLKRTAYISRGACVPHAPKNAGSFLTRYACRMASQDFGWRVFFAYSDTHDASEIGTIYQACGWFYLGEGLGRPSGSTHIDFLSPDKDEIITSYMLNHGTCDERIKSMGWTGRKGMKRETLRKLGWTAILRFGKKKWAWFEGTPLEKKKMAEACRIHLGIKKKDWPLSYPKRPTC